MKKILALIFCLLLAIGAYVYADGIGDDGIGGEGVESTDGVGGEGIDTTSTSTNAVLWDAGGAAVLWDATGDKVLWETP